MDHISSAAGEKNRVFLALVDSIKKKSKSVSPKPTQKLISGLVISRKKITNLMRLEVLTFTPLTRKGKILESSEKEIQPKKYKFITRYF